MIIRHVAKKRISDKARGFLSKYANPDLIELEKEAGKLHAIKKYAVDTQIKK